MGSFNMTCSVSRLPITAGTPVRAFLIAQPSAEPDYIFHPSSVYTPVAPGIAGKYDDYGRIEDVSLSAGFDFFREKNLPHLKGDPESLFDSATHEKITLKRLGQALPCKTSLAFVREDVYREVLRLSGRSAIDRKKMEKDLRQMQAAVKDYRTLTKDYTPGQVDMIMARSAYSIISRASKTECAQWYLTPFFESVSDNDVVAYQQAALGHIIGELEKDPKISKKTVDMAMEMAELLRFDYALRDLCVMWQPSTNLVGQETPYKLQMEFNKAVDGICKKELAAIKAEERKYNAEAKKASRKPGR